jgi:hypothetical protein
VRALIAGLLLALAGCAAAPPRPSPDPGPGQVLERFLVAVGRHDMDTAYELLSGRWRARLTPDRLARDLDEGGDVAADRLARARLAARSDPLVEGDLAAFSIGDGRAVRLVREPGGWRVDALE